MARGLDVPFSRPSKGLVLFFSWVFGPAAATANNWSTNLALGATGANRRGALATHLVRETVCPFRGFPLPLVDPAPFVMLDPEQLVDLWLNLVADLTPEVLELCPGRGTCRHSETCRRKFLGTRHEARSGGLGMRFQRASYRSPPIFFERTSFWKFLGKFPARANCGKIGL